MSDETHLDADGWCTCVGHQRLKREAAAAEDERELVAREALGRARRLLDETRAALRGDVERRFEALAREILGETAGSPASGIRKVLLFAPSYYTAREMAREAGLGPHQVMYVHTLSQLWGLTGQRYRYLAWEDRYHIPPEMLLQLLHHEIKRVTPEELADLTNRNGETT